MARNPITRTVDKAIKAERTKADNLYLRQVMRRANVSLGSLQAEVDLLGTTKANIASPTFTGTVTMPVLRITDTTDATLSSTGHPFQIGPTSGVNLVIDGNEIIARNNGAGSFLALNMEGNGTVQIGGGGSTILDLRDGWLRYPATQNPSSHANTLDDYEEGTFTPSLLFGGAAVGMTYNLRTGNYVIIAGSILWNATIQLAARGSSTGAATVSGVPSPTVANQALAAVAFNGFSLTGAFVAYGGVTLRQTTASGSAALNETNFSNTSFFSINGGVV